mgnify:CR=1 FL=1|tara:strand:- start:88 stop:606 length:519 start_codon:yes stop_codon:yes gene_type:complete
MALWGKSELIYNSGKVTVNFSDKQIKRTSGTVNFVSAGIKTGDVFTVGTAGSIGAAVVESVVSSTVVSIASTNDLVYLGNNQITGQDYYVNEKPKYTLDDPKFNAPEVKANGATVEILGIDDSEASEAISAGFGSFAQHSGWVGVTTYTDCHGNLRVKAETLVASSSITDDR